MPLKATLGDMDFYAWNLTEKDRGKPFFCKYCREDGKPDKMIVVLPKENIIKHFRHKSGNYHGEPETREHLAAKMFMMNMVDKSADHVNIEVRIGSHIADVVADSLVYECQYSGISVKSMIDREICYQNNGFDTKWVFVKGKTFSMKHKLLVSDVEIEYGMNGRAEAICWYPIHRARKCEKHALYAKKAYYLLDGDLYEAWFGCYGFSIKFIYGKSEAECRKILRLANQKKLQRITKHQEFQRKLEKIGQQKWLELMVEYRKKLKSMTEYRKALELNEEYKKLRLLEKQKRSEYIAEQQARLEFVEKEKQLDALRNQENLRLIDELFEYVRKLKEAHKLQEAARYARPAEVTNMEVQS